MLVLAVIHVVAAQQTPPKPPLLVEPSRTPFGKTVAGAGITEARTQNIAVGTALPGIVLDVYVPDPHSGKFAAGDPQNLIGKTVKKGDPLFLVDDRQLKAQLKSNQANVASAMAQLEKLKREPPSCSALCRFLSAVASARQPRSSTQRDSALRLRPFRAASAQGLVGTPPSLMCSPTMK